MNYELTQTAVRAMKDARLPATMRRVAVWTVIAQAGRPIETAEIKRRLIHTDADMPISSIYATLKRLVEAKMLSTYTAGGITYYSLPARNFRQRIVCTESGKAYWFDDQELARAVHAFCRRHGFGLTDYTLSVRGRLAPGEKGRLDRY